jgi:DNA-directed RNA polymerase specialized sigma24 family protein
MDQKSMIDQTAFERLLFWLNPDRDQAAQKYEAVRRRLIEIFASRGFSDAGHLADDTIDRVISKVEKVSDGWVGDPAYFFLGVARKIMLEKSKPAPAVLPPPPPDEDDIERRELEDRCLEKCLGLLSQENRKLILEYVNGKKKERLEQAQSLKLTPNALRIRVHEIKKTIRPCVENCLAEETR